MLLVYLCAFLVAAHCKPFQIPQESPEKWVEIAQQDLKLAFYHRENRSAVAKNVIFYLGDGMGISTVTAGRIYKGQRHQGASGEEGFLSWEKFPHVALLKTYNTDHQVADSAGTATAFLSGYKTNMGNIGVNQDAPYNNCSAYDSAKHDVSSILHFASKEGKSIGLITRTSITHATPASAYAHTVNRMWQDDTYRNRDVPQKENRYKCLDIAQQLVNNALNFQVLMGGGLAKFRSKENNGSRSDGQDLIALWRERQAHRRAKVFTNARDLQNADLSKVDYLFALLAASHMRFSEDTKSEITLAKMTDIALGILKRNPKGFLLFVEGGMIDKAHHNNNARLALGEMVALDEAVTVGLQNTDPTETLIVVSADHSHQFSIGGGHPSRGNDILGKSDWKEWRSPEAAGYGRDGLPYTTLGYYNGPSASVNMKRRNISLDNTGILGYMMPSLVPLGQATHGGEDVGLWAQGPGAWLFRSTHEQNYVAHAIMLASCSGVYATHEHCGSVSSASVVLSKGWIQTSLFFITQLICKHILSSAICNNFNLLSV